MMRINQKSGLGYCHSIIGDVSRTFALSIERVEGLLSNYTCISYLLCRIPDTIEDANNIPPKEKRELLDLYYRILKSNRSERQEIRNFVERANKYRSGEPYWDLVRNTDRVFEAFGNFSGKVRDSIKTPIKKMIRGIRGVIGRHDDRVRISNMDDFSEYCYHVAGTVGDTLTELFRITEDLSDDTTEKLQEYSHNFGEALQSVNIIKDVHNDYHKEDNIYIPESLLNKYGTSQEKMLEDRESTLRAIDDLIKHADSKLEDARKYIELLPTEARNARHFTIIPYLLAVSTLREVKRRKGDLLESAPVKVSRSEVLVILDRIPECIEDNDYLGELASRAERTEIKPEMAVQV